MGANRNEEVTNEDGELIRHDTVDSNLESILSLLNTENTVSFNLYQEGLDVTNAELISAQNGDWNTTATATIYEKKIEYSVVFISLDENSFPLSITLTSPDGRTVLAFT